jgi:terminase large subunit-like protein
VPVILDDNEFLSKYRGNTHLKKPGVQIEWTTEMIAEYVKCRDDPIYFIEKYIRIVTEDGLVPIKLRDYQTDMILKMYKNRNLISLQSRQSGKTETVRGFVLHYILFNDQKTVAILADKEDTVKETLYKIQIAYQQLPGWLQLGLFEWNKGKVELENGSRIIVAGTGSNSIRGLTIHVLILDECAHISNFQEFYSSVLPTISAGKATKLIMTSTPKGLNHFYKFWVDSERGDNDFVRIFVPWQIVPGRDAAWKEAELRRMNGDLELFEQEYECQFKGSSGTLISGKKLRELVYKNPIRHDDGLSQFVEPQVGHSYVIVVDVSRGKGLDYSAFSCVDVTAMPYVQVATFRSNLVTPIDYAGVIHTVAKTYGNASILVEVNDLGAQVSGALYYDYEYENVLFTENAGRAGKRITTVGGKNADMGIMTSKQSKSVGCSILKLLIENDQFIVNDIFTIEELSTFSRKNNSYEAEPGKHDDLVMGLVIFAWLSDQKYFREFTNINTLSTLREKTDEEIMADLSPFGFVDDHGGDNLEAREFERGNWLFPREVEEL